MQYRFRNRPRKISTLCFSVMLLWAGVSVAEQNQDARDKDAQTKVEQTTVAREEAVELARQGNPDAAITKLESLARESDDPRIRYDLIAIFDWAGRDAAVVRTWKKMGSPLDMPDYVRVALVDALIAKENWQLAERVTANWLRQSPDNVDALFFTGQIQEAGGDRYAALLHYQRAMQIAPANQSIRSRTVALLTELGAVSAAARLASEPTPELQASLTAQKVRWSVQLSPVSPSQPYVHLDDAITDLKQQLAAAKRQTPRDQALLRRLHGDLAQALSDRQDFAGVLEQVAYLQDTGGVPGYVRLAQGNALLAQRQPEQARLVFEQILQQDPGQRAAQQGLLWALIDLNQWQAAFDLADRIEPNSSLKLPRSNVPYGNNAWLNARIQAASIRSWADQNQLAWDMITPLLSAAPAEPDLQIAAATIAAARGWPRLGQQKAEIALNLAPESQASALAVARAQMSRAQWDKAERALTELNQAYPNNAEVAEFAKDLGVQHMYELVADLQVENDSGQSFYAPGEGYQSSVYLYSPRLNHRWRLYSAATAGRARSPDVFTATREQIGLGALIQWPDLELDASVWQNFGSVQKTSVNLNGSWSPDDHWQFEAGYSSFTSDMPLRALAYGVTANEFSGGVSYSWSNTSSLAAGYVVQDFSDGNRRQSASASANQLIYSMPDAQISVIPSIYASTNTDDSVDYFSPKRDLSLDLALQGERVLWRQYERRFGDRLLVGAGNYWQESYGNGLIAEVTYEQFFVIDPVFEINYGLGWTRRIYDGDPENAWQFTLNAVVRF